MAAPHTSKLRTLEKQNGDLKAQNRRLTDTAIKLGFEVAIRDEELRFMRALIGPAETKLREAWPVMPKRHKPRKPLA